jgi:polysaccharide pyruvyl transferase WcaK-like protein
MTGTGMLTDYSTSCFGYPYDVFKWTVAAKLAGCKVWFLGIGVGPVYERLSRVFIRSALALADYRSFRDDVSVRRLKALGFHRDTDPVLPDLAFSLPPSVFAAAQPASGRTVGLGVMNYVDPHAVGPAEAVVQYGRYLERMCDFVAWLIKHNYRVRILQGDSKHDPPVRRDLRNALQKEGIRYEEAGIVDEDAESVDELLRQIGTCDIIVSPRFHNLILGLMSGRPVMSISYDPKHEALMEAFGLAGFSQPIHGLDLEALIERFLQLEAAGEQRRALLRGKAEEYRVLLDRQYQNLFEAI